MAKYPVDFAARLSKAIAAASRSLAKDSEDEATAWRELLRADRAWPLSVLLAFWYLLQTRRELPYQAAIRSLAEEAPTRAPGADFYGLWRVFDVYKALLSRPAQLAYDAKTPLDLTAAGGAFKYAAQQIGLAQLDVALKSRLFAVVSEVVSQAVPPPEDVRSSSDLGRVSQPDTTAAAAARPAQRVLPVKADLTARDRCVLLLVSRGHSAAEAEQICQGPPRVASQLRAPGKGSRA